MEKLSIIGYKFLNNSNQDEVMLMNLLVSLVMVPTQNNSRRPPSNTPLVQVWEQMEKG